MDNKQTYIVLGCGHFGQGAVKAIKSLPSQPSVIAVDIDEEMLQTVEAQADQVHHADGVQYLKELSESEAASCWVVPALPLHLAFEWLLLGLSTTAERMSVPQAFNPEGVLQQHRTQDGTLYCSLGDFTCPEDCPEPDEYCHITEEPRTAPLYRILDETPCAGFHSLVIRSQLVVPGVGGYPFADLLTLRALLLIAGGDYLISTACTCHGVTDAVSINVNNKLEETG